MFMNPWMFISLVSIATSFGLAIWLRQVAQERSSLESTHKALVKVLEETESYLSYTEEENMDNYF